MTRFDGKVVVITGGNSGIGLAAAKAFAKAIPLLAEDGSVIIISSVAASKGMAAGTVYSASKAAVRSFGRSFAAELVSRGVRVIVVRPGPIDTPIYERPSGVPAEALKQKFTSSVPMQRLGTAGDSMSFSKR